MQHPRYRLPPTSPPHTLPHRTPLYEHTQQHFDMAFIYAGIDLGTTSTGIVAKFVRVGESLETTVIEVVLLPGSKNHQDVEAPQIAVYWNGALVYGKSVKGVIAEHPDMQDEVLQFYKLALHPSFKKFPEVAHVHKVLCTRKNRGALQDLFTDLFRAFKRDILAYFESETMDDYIDFSNVQLVFQISVPVMWGDEPSGIIRNAAKRAGISKVELREKVFVCCHRSYGGTAPKAGNQARSMPFLVGHWWRHDRYHGLPDG